jgi:hypothetical protein
MRPNFLRSILSSGFLKKNLGSMIPMKLSSPLSLNSRSHQFASYQNSHIYPEVGFTGGSSNLLASTDVIFDESRIF